MLRPLCLTLCLLLPAAGRAADRLGFGLDWRAQAEHGGFYQALATGLYAARGLDVTLRQGGPQVNQAQLLLAGRLDLVMTSNGFLVLNMAQEKLPLAAIAAFFQKDPAVLIAHPGQGNDSFEALRGKPIMIGADTRAGWWSFLRARFGYTDTQVRPYTFNLAPFLADPRAIQQGYLGSEPFSIREQAGFDPVVLLLADAGFDGYGCLLVAGTGMAEGRAEALRRFVAASAEGWRSFLDGDPGPAHALIKRDNPEMTDALLAYGRAALKSHGIVDGGDAARLGVGAMTEARWDGFVRSVAGQGVYAPGLDWRRAVDFRFAGATAPR